MINIKHNPLFDVEKVAAHYSQKDGVPIKYVCTSAIHRSATYAADIFYRETPHPKFGNHYFGLYRNIHANNAQIMITNADAIEQLEFNMVVVEGTLHYSQHRHDFRTIGNGVAIDGGRDYFRASYTNKDAFTRQTLKINNGCFIVVDNIY